jgi:exonuclease III
MLKSIKNKVLRVFHQNIRGLRNKTNELISSMHSNLPHILCLTEHHMKQLELEHFHIENYNLGARYCRKTLEKGGVSIFVHKNLKFTKINLEDYCKDQDLCFKVRLYIF